MNIATGSDMQVDMVLQVQINQLKAENIIDDTVWIRKSHYSFPINTTDTFYCNKVICSVRNPLDMMPSLLMLLITYT